MSAESMSSAFAMTVGHIDDRKKAHDKTKKELKQEIERNRKACFERIEQVKKDLQGKIDENAKKINAISTGIEEIRLHSSKQTDLYGCHCLE